MALILAFAGPACHAQEALNNAGPAASLPSLPGEARDVPDYFSVDSESISLGSATYSNAWNAQWEDYLGSAPSFKFDKGLRLKGNLAVGAALTYHGGVLDSLFNAAYTPMRNLRMQFSANQIRTVGRSGSLVSGSNAIRQTGILASIRKGGRPASFISDFGIAFYGATAAGFLASGTSAMESEDAGNEENQPANEAAYGSLGGYLLDLVLRPTRHSSIALEHNRERRAYWLSGTLPMPEYRTVNSLRYSHSLGNCGSFQGSWSTDAGLRQLDLGLEKGNWTLGITHTHDEEENDYSFRLAYSIPLDTVSAAGAGCNADSRESPSFGTIMDAVVERPEQLPAEPLPIF